MAVADRKGAFGPILQIAMVVPDLETSVAAFVALGAGPFFRIEASPDTTTVHRGVERRTDHVLAIGHWGEMQIECIEQRCDTPSVYREFVEEGQVGTHHVLCTTPDIDVLIAGLDPARHEILTTVDLGPAGRVVYLRMAGQRWPLIEIGQFGRPVLDLFAHVRAASIGWDGTAPLRTLDGGSHPQTT